MQHPFAPSERGQTLTLFALMLVVLLLAAGLVVDVGYALSQQRTAQNAADFAALAGTRIVGESYTGNPAGAGTDANVIASIQSVLSANRAQLVTAQYVNNTGAALVGNVGGGTIPSGAVGVVVNAKTSWKPFFLGIIGVASWSAGTTATAVTPAGAAPAGVMPVGIQDTAYNQLPSCDPALPSFSSCITTTTANLTPGGNIQSGQKGWLKFGAGGKCALNGVNFGLGMSGGCGNSETFLQGEVGPPAQSHGCCDDLTKTPTAYRLIGGMTGNKWANLTYYIQHQLTVWVPIWDWTTDTGNNAYYHIVGFAGIVFVGGDTQHGRWLTGIAVSNTLGTTPNSVTLGATGAVQLVH